MAVTRIKNNQITDSTIVANTKIVNYSVTSTLLANNLTYGSDLTIAGNLTVQGNTTTIDTTIVTVEDPMISLAYNQTGSPTLDIGWIGVRGTANNVAFIWDESALEFVTAFTTDDIGNTTISLIGYANLHMLNANVGGNLTIGGNIDITGNITSLNVTGNITGGNLLTPGIVSATANVTGGNITTGGQVVATANVTGGNINTAGVASVGGNVIGANLTTGGVVTATGNIDGGNFNTAGRANITGNITGGNVLTGGLISATSTITSAANITGGNVLTGGLISATGNIDSGANIVATANVIGGNISTAGQVTATGNVTGGNVLTGGLISATGNISGGNLYSAGTVTSVGNITAPYFIGNIQGNIDAGGANTQIQFNDADILAGSAGFTFDKTANLVTVAGNVQGGNLLTGGLISATANITGGNVLTGGLISATGNINSGANIVATANVIGGNISTAGVATVTGNIDSGANIVATANVIGGNLVTAGVATVTGNINSGANIVATANVIGGNISTAGQVTATGNVTGGNVISQALVQGVTVSASGNVIGGNLTTGGIATVTGNINGGGNLNISGNVIGANVRTAGEVSAAGNVTANNVNTDNVYSSGALTLTAASGDLVLNPSGNIVLDAGKYINNVLDPIRAQDAASKQYVDDMVSSGITIHTPVLLEANTAINGTYAQGGTTATVTSTVAGNTVVFSSAISPQVNDQYWFTSSFSGIVANTAYFVVSAPNTSAAVLSTTYNGAPVTNITSAPSVNQPVRINSGVGATLTNAGANTVLTIDGVTTTANIRVLIYSEANAVHNGVYVVNQPGNATTAWQLTRSTDTDIYGPKSTDELDVGDYFYVQDGDTGAGESYVMTAPEGPFIIGYNNITFTQFSASQVYTANTAAGLTLTGTVFSAKVDNNTTAFDGGGNIIVKASANLTTPNIGAATGTSLNATANITGGNLLTGGLISATGNINSGANIIATANVIGGNISTAGVATVTGNINSGANIIATANVIGGNISTAGLITATGNVTGGNLITAGVATVTGNIDSGANIVATANVIGGNISTAGQVTATANITGGNILTGGLISATANITGGNVNTAGEVDAASITATGNVVGGNVSTAGLVTATGNVTGGNVLTGGLISATGNITGGNILSGGSGSFTGNVTAANFFGNISGNIDAAGANTQVQFNDTGDILGASAGFTFDKTANLLTVAGNIAGGNLTTGGQVSATANVTGGNILTGGLISATGNGTFGNVGTNQLSLSGNVISALNVTGNITGSNLITSGNVFAPAIIANSSTYDTRISLSSAAGIVEIISNGNATQFTPAGQINLSGVSTIAGGTFTGSGFTAGPSQTDLFQNRGGNVTVQVGTGGTIASTWTFAQGGNLLAPGAISATGNITGANLILTGGAINGPAAGRVTINSSDIDTDFAVDGDTVANIFYVDAGTGTASFGTSTQLTNAIVAFNATTSILFPVGNTGQRPGTGATGMVRFNTTNNNLEVFDNSQWTAVGVPSFTVIADEQFNGDGTTVAFTLDTTQTTNSCIVSINGVLQIPTVAYSVSGTDPTCVLTFTEAPLAGDVIDVRQITTTTTVTALSNTSGNAVVEVLGDADSVQITGNLVPLTANAKNLGSSSKPWQSLYVAGNTIYLGTLQLKQTDAATFTVFQADGVTQANIDVGNVDVSALNSGNSIIGISGTNGNAYITVRGVANVLVASNTGVAVTGTVSATANITGGNILTGGLISATGTITSAANITGGNILTGGIVSVTGNVQGGNLRTEGQISATGNISGTNLSGTNLTVSTGNITGGNLILSGAILDSGQLDIQTTGLNSNIALTPNGTGMVTVSSQISVVGNVQGGNIRTAGLISATGAITGAAITGSSLTVTTGNVTAGNIVNGNANGVGNIGSATTYFNTVFAKATSAQYADLAEKYVADEMYEPGNVVSFGGDCEVTLTTSDSDHRVAGVISTNPSYIMNAGIDGIFIATVALTGRVPCRVTGTVRKGDLMVSAGNGTARAETNPRVGTVIGKALEDFDGVEGTIEVVVGRF